MDFAELSDLSAEQPERLVAMREMWWHEAGRFGVAPLDDRFLERANSRAGTELATTTRFEYFRGMPRLPEAAGADVRVGNFRISCALRDLTDDDRGVILSFGGRHAGFVWYVDDGRLCLDYNSYGHITAAQSQQQLPTGSCEVAMVWRTEGAAAAVDLTIDGTVGAQTAIDRPVPYYTGGHGFEVGGNWTSQVSPNYEQPFEFTGTFDSVVIEISGEIDVARAAEVSRRAECPSSAPPVTRGRLDAGRRDCPSSRCVWR